MNMDMGGQKWSSVHQEYASLDGKRSAELSIIAGKAAPQAQAFQAMANMNMETEDQVMKTVDVAGHKGMLTLDKKDKSGTLNHAAGTTAPARPNRSQGEINF
jgi:hypothetical protein